jgi:hypothetical protein
MQPRVSISPLPPGFALARFVKSLPHGPEFAAAQFPEQPVVAHAITAMQNKSAVPGMTTANTDLATLGVLDTQTALLLAGESAFEACRSRMRELQFNLAVPRQADAGTGGGWIGKGHPMPVIKAGLFDEIAFDPARLGSICVLTNDVLRRRGTEAIIRNAALGTQGRVETFNFLDPSVAATADAPASITNTGTAVPWSGDATAVVQAMLAAITTTGKGLAWIGRPADLASLAAQLGATGERALLGLPTIFAPNAPAGLVVLADLSEIAYAATAIEIDKSDQATLQMDSAPTNAVASGSPEAPVATQVVSLFQANAVAFKVWRFANWEPRDGSVVYTVMSTGS